MSRLVVHVARDALTELVRTAATRSLDVATEHVLGVANQRVPIEEGTLERSGAADVDAATLTGSVSYDTPYAVRQHEDLSMRHDRGRQAKYLETASLDELHTIAALQARAAKEALG